MCQIDTDARNLIDATCCHCIKLGLLGIEESFCSHTRTQKYNLGDLMCLAVEREGSDEYESNYWTCNLVVLFLSQLICD